MTPSERQAAKTRGGDGKFARSPETAERDAHAAELRRRGYSYRAIAADMGVTPGAAHVAVQRALRAIVEEPAQDVRAMELERLDAMERKVQEILARKHITVNNGRVIYLDDQPVPDDTVTLQAIDRLLKIQERRARLLGLDAPAKTEMGATVRYEIVGADMEAL